MKSLLFFGDSIMAGRGVTKPESYFGLAKETMQGATPGELSMYNFAIPGESTELVLGRLQKEVTPRRFNTQPIIVLGCGINDAKTIEGKPVSTPEHFQEIFTETVLTAKSLSSNLLVIGLTPIESIAYQYGFFSAQILEFDNIIKKICLDAKVKYISLSELWNKNNILLDDGIHLNNLGHQLVWEIIRPELYQIISSTSIPEDVSVETLGFSSSDSEQINNNLSNQISLYNSNLVIGSTQDTTPDIVVGGPCLRKDIEGVSFNSFYQVLMPLLIAKKYGTQCAIFLGIQEEIWLMPRKEKDFLALGNKMADLVKNLSGLLGVETVIINTTDKSSNDNLEKLVEKLAVRLSQEQSTYLFSVKKDPNKPLHSPERAHISERVLLCHSYKGLEALLGISNPLIVEDIEQFNCFLKAIDIDDKQTANFLGFLPMPALNYRSNMFKAGQIDRLILNKDSEYYAHVYRNSSRRAIAFYLEVLRLFKIANGQELLPKGEKFFIQTITEISNQIKRPVHNTGQSFKAKLGQQLSTDISQAFGI